MNITFKVEGEPVAAPRPRARIVQPRKGKPWVHMYTPDTDEAWKKRVALEAWRHVKQPFSGPMRVDVEFIMPRPQAHFGTGRNAGALKDSAPHWHEIKPDRDNLDKPVLDALKAAGVFADDCQVCSGLIEKRYTRPGENPGATVSITPLSKEQQLWENSKPRLSTSPSRSEA